MSVRRSFVANHEPQKGKLRQVLIAVREDGQAVDPIDQVVVVEGGYQATLTFATAADETITVTINGTPITIAATAAAGNGGNRDLAYEEINAQAVIALTSVAAVKSDAAELTLCSSKTFTLAATADTPVNISAGSVGSAAGSVAANATSITLAAPLLGAINAGQYLTFADADGIESVVRVAAKAEADATSLVIDAAPEAIAGGAIAEFPCYLWDRTDASISRSYSQSSVTTYNTGQDTDGVPTNSEKSISCAGLYHYTNAAARTALAAADAGKYVHCRVVDPIPNSNFKRGRVTEGRALVTSAGSAAPADGNISLDIDIQWRGPVTEREPVTAY
ncbi:MAG: phage tail tube protein [Cyanobacteria bacterium P01_H01_bin.121]